MFNSLGGVTRLPKGSSAVGLPPFSLWTSICSISSAHNGTHTAVTWPHKPHKLGHPRAGEDGVWVGEVTECTSLPLAAKQLNLHYV